jgi:hypothetical protein
MKYKDLLQSEGLAVTESQLRRFKEFGLITTTLKSKGKSSGVHAQLPPITVDAIKEIYNLRKQRYIKNDRESIFVLFIKGYPVSLDVLKRKIKDFLQNRIVDGFAVMNKSIKNPKEQGLYFSIMDYLKATQINPKVGRPSKEDEEVLDKKISKMMQEFMTFQPLLAYFSGEQDASSSSKQKFQKRYGYSIEQLPAWLDYQYWTDLIDRSTKSDFKQILEVWQLILVYLEILESHQSYSKAREMLIFLEEKKFLERIEIINLFLLIMVNPSWRNHVMTFLNDEKTKEVWRNLWKGGDPQ